MWIGVFLDQGQPLGEAISKCVEILEGAYSFVLISILEPDAMYIVKNTGTMVIGVAKELEMGSPSKRQPQPPVIHTINEKEISPFKLSRENSAQDGAASTSDDTMKASPCA